MNHPESYEKYLKIDGLREYEDLYDEEKVREHDIAEKQWAELLEKKPEKMIMPEKTRLAVLLRAKGYSIREICERVQLSKPKVIDVIRDYAREISKLSRLELQELLALHQQTAFKKIQVFGGVLNRLLEELKGRDLADIPTDRLLEVILKYNKAIGDSITEKIASMPTMEPESNEEVELYKASIL